MTSQVQVCGDGEWERKRSDEQLRPKEERWAQGRGVSRCLERVRHRLGDVRVVPQTSSKRAQHCFLWQVIFIYRRQNVLYSKAVCEMFVHAR